MEIVMSRHWGEPKLKKPKCCNNKTLLGSVTFHGDCPCKFKLWNDNGTYYIFWRDWFSPSMTNRDAAALGLCELRTKQKFQYADGDGPDALMIFRNEAIISFTKDDWYYGGIQADYNMCGSFEKMIENSPLVKTLGKPNGYYHKQPWTGLFEDCLKLAGVSPFDTYENKNNKVFKEFILNEHSKS